MLLIIWCVVKNLQLDGASWEGGVSRHRDALICDSVFKVWCMSWLMNDDKLTVIWYIQLRNFKSVHFTLQELGKWK